MWMSSSASEKGNSPRSISPAMASSPSRMLVSSSGEMIPTWASMAAWARLPRMSWRHISRSKPIEALMACMTAEGPPA